MTQQMPAPLVLPAPGNGAQQAIGMIRQSGAQPMQQNRSMPDLASMVEAYGQRNPRPVGTPVQGKAKPPPMRGLFGLGRGF